ncbi:MAG TPA: stage II sporulation protein P [bacterium]|jgi:stage II sporulation protein P|nr:stage II sporulation protein P [bacterium]
MIKLRRHMLGFILLAVLILGFNNEAWAHKERSDGYFSFINPQGEVFFQTALMVSLGDEFIAHDNRQYCVSKLDGDNAHCEYLGPASPAEMVRATFSGSESSAVSSAAARSSVIGIYHTHSDESYVPTEGTASIFGQGGIIKVGSAFKNALLKAGLKAVHDTTPHDPHDAMSYTRSRRTAAQLLKQGSVALFDIHRDAVPRELYVASVKGQDVTKLTLVIGRENPQVKANLNFAKQLKDLNDQENPGLIKGIFLTRGIFNQDLFDRAILIEVGTHENSRPAAERGISLFASTLPAAIGKQGLPAKTQSTGATQRTGSWSAVVWILLLVTVGGVIYLYLATGSWVELQAKVKHFATREFQELRGRNRDSDDTN